MPAQTEVYAAIEADLKDAEQHLDQSSRYRASKDLVNAIKARLYLYRGRYNEAREFAEKVISNGSNKLTQAGDFKQDEVRRIRGDKLFYARRRF